MHFVQTGFLAMRSLLGGGGGRVRGGRGRGGLSVLLLHLVFCLLLLVGAALGDPRAAASPDSPHQSIQDPENPDFSGVVDFSNAVPGPDGSWCITKIKYVDHMENDEVKECWHQNVTQCHDTYITEFLPSQEQKCEETFWKSCKIDFKEMPFNYTLKQCHTPLVKKCDDYAKPAEYGAPAKTVCRTWFESECNTTYVDSPSGDLKPNTWCQKKPRKICAPDNCNMIQGPEDCRDKVMISTIQKPEEHCTLQPQRHCRLITKLVPHLTTKEVCKEIPKEICVMKLVNPHPVQKPIQLKWCTKKPPQDKLPSYAPPTSYLPSASSYNPSPPQYTPSYTQSQDLPSYLKREDQDVYQDQDQYQDQLVFVEDNDFDNNVLSDYAQIPLPQGPPSFRGIRQDVVEVETPRFTRQTKQPLAFPHMKPGFNPDHAKPNHPTPIKTSDLSGQGSETKVQIVKPQPGSNIALRVPTFPVTARTITTETNPTVDSSTTFSTTSSVASSVASLSTSSSTSFSPSPSSPLPSAPTTSSSFRPAHVFETNHKTISETSIGENLVPDPNLEPERAVRKPRHFTPSFSTSSSLRNYPGSIL
ncbi:uncharacterized protein LOC111709001 [Eurytemora carolleeae]|uniref:uncharacterized protein LOC111709001 n=1 Tax=Eurytemora carolleeae TaxID=1294199 RepID=UPI000C7738BD|nr:uncharacterized protein LOC111709001 [Eurytemora carolleeae]|eukprot:XP_023338332.1 uncharacterized protein LOC111709001 [Eurytemora affinis]